MLQNATPYSYRATVPSFRDDQPLFVFDGVCVLCSTGVRWLTKYDHGQFRFSTVQTPLGQALYAHYGLRLDDSYLLIHEGRAYQKSDGYLHMLDILGGGWRLLKFVHLIPRPVRDFIYDLFARHRYRWFGKTGYCQLIPEAMRKRLLA